MNEHLEKNYNQNNPYEVAQRGSVEQMVVLVNQAKDKTAATDLINKKNDKGLNVFHYACLRALGKNNNEIHDGCDIKMLEYLMFKNDKFEVDCCLTLDDSYPPRPMMLDKRLYNSNKNKAYQVMRCLLDSQKSLSLVYDDLAALSLAIDSNSYMFLSALVTYICAKEQPSVDYKLSGCDVVNKDNQTPLHQAIKKNKFDFARKLLNCAYYTKVKKETVPAFRCLISKATDHKEARDLLEQNIFSTFKRNIFFVYFVEEDQSHNLNKKEKEGFEINLKIDKFEKHWTEDKLNLVISTFLPVESSCFDIKAWFIDNPVYIERFVIAFLSHGLYRQNADKCNAIIQSDSWFWWTIREVIELNIERLYQLTTPIICDCAKITLFHTNDEKVIQKRFNHCRKKFGRKIMSKLNQNIESNESLKDMFLNRADTLFDKKYYENGIKIWLSPMQSILFWSVFSCRWNVTKILLSGREIDCIPLCLTLMQVLNKIEARLEGMNCRHSVMLGELKEMCIQKLLTICNYCSSYVTTNEDRIKASIYLNTPLPGYCGKSCVELASRCGSTLILETTLFAEAINSKFKGPFMHVSHMGLIPFVIGGLVMWPLVKRSCCPDSNNKNKDDGDDLNLSRKSEIKDILPENSRQSGFVDRLKAAFTRKTVSDSQKNLRHKESKKEKFSNSQKYPKNEESQKVVSKRFFEEYGLGKMNKIFAANNDNLSSDDMKLDEPTIRNRDIWNRPDFYTAPLMKIQYQIIMHIVLFVIAGIVVGTNNTCKSLTRMEIAMYVILSGYCFEEVKELVCHFKTQTVISLFLSNKWNWLDMLYLVFFSVSLVFRLFVQYRDDDPTDYHSIMHIFRGLGLLLFGMRFLYICLLFESLGIKLYVSYLMFKNDLLPTLFIILVIGLSFGILMQSIINEDEKGKYFLAGLFEIVFYSMFGEYNLDGLKLPESSTNATVNRFGGKYTKTMVLLVILPFYIVMTQLLLINLIIALFTRTLEKYTQVSRGLWLKHRCDMMTESKTRSILPPPFNVPETVVTLIYRIYKLFCVRNNRKSNNNNSKSDINRFEFYLALSIVKESN